MAQDVRMLIHAYPEDEALLSEAVRAGGGVVVEADDANAVIWTTRTAPELKAVLSDRIRWVQLGSAGIEDYFKAGVVDDARVWTSATGVYAYPCAEYVVTMMLAVSRRVHELVGTKSWRPLAGQMLRGKTVGVIGAGSIGREVFRLLEPFGMRKIALTRSGSKLDGADLSLPRAELDHLLHESDFVVLSAPLTPETAGLISSNELAMMRPGAWLINVARGGLVDTDALSKSLWTTSSLGGAPFRGIAGAVLDVTAPEPLPDDHPLWKHPNVVITSHTASYWRLGLPLLAERVRQNVEAFREGRPLDGLIDPGNEY